MINVERTSGYVGTTDREWFGFQRSMGHDEVIFWRRASSALNLQPESCFFFLVKGIRLIKGYGIIYELGSKRTGDLWEQYGVKLGTNTMYELCEKLGKGERELIGYYRLGGVEYLDRGIEPREAGIEFAISVVSGKRITEEQTAKLLQLLRERGAVRAAEVSPIPGPVKQQSTKPLSMLEANLEDLVIAQLESVEPGLKLLERQCQVGSVGRIDLLCEDKEGNLVVIEIKAARGDTQSVIDQITRYMGWIEEYKAKSEQKVRGIIIVGRQSDNLKYAAKVIPNLQIKVFSLSLQ